MSSSFKWCRLNNGFNFIAGIGLDSSVIKLKKHDDLYLVQSVDFFYPLVDDPFLMGEHFLNQPLIKLSNIFINSGKIAFVNVVSDLYAMGVSEIDEVKMLISTSTEFTDDERDSVIPDIIDGFRDSAREIKCNLTLVV